MACAVSTSNSIPNLALVFGPYYVTLARGESGDEENVAFAMLFAVVVQLVLSLLYHVMLGLEDPFAAHMPGR